jgi:DNA polymerase-3 subunit alpha (Gram-positive type)
MSRCSNLISQSILVTDVIELVSAMGGRASAVHVVDHVMKIKSPEPSLARLLLSDLIDRDPRLKLDDDFVECILVDHESRELAETGFVVFDLETTGAKAPPCRITEVGAFRVRNGMVEEKFHTLVNPQTPIPPFIVSLTGITDDMVRQAPTFSEIAADFLDFIGDSVLVAHNAGFDMGFLNHEIGLLYEGYRVGNPCLCTVQLSRRLLPDIQNHKLNTVADHFSIGLENHHRASDDAYATAWIFVRLLDDLRMRGVRNIGGIRQFSKKNYARRKAAEGKPSEPADRSHAA